jgi:hypothetical protein
MKFITVLLLTVFSLSASAQVSIHEECVSEINKALRVGKVKSESPDVEFKQYEGIGSPFRLGSSGIEAERPVVENGVSKVKIFIDFWSNFFNPALWDNNRENNIKRTVTASFEPLNPNKTKDQPGYQSGQKLTQIVDRFRVKGRQGLETRIIYISYGETIGNKVNCTVGTEPPKDEPPKVKIVEFSSAPETNGASLNSGRGNPTGAAN